MQKTQFVCCGQSGISLCQAEVLLLQQYNMLALGYSHCDGYSVETQIYQKIPNFFINKAQLTFKKCFSLGECSFQDMFTLLIFQHIYQNEKDKTNILNDLKNMIYNDSFMNGQFYTKGLIVKGFSLMQQEAQYNKSNQRLFGECLLRQNLARAFNECWKELYSEVSMEKINQNTLEQKEVQMLDTLGCYFTVQFCVFLKDNNIITQMPGNQNGTSIDIVFNRDFSKEKNWKYFVVVGKNEKQNEKIRQKSKMEDISRIDEAEQSSNSIDCMKNLLLNKHQERLQKTKNCSYQKNYKQLELKAALNEIRQTITRGDNLIKDCQAYLTEIQIQQ